MCVLYFFEVTECSYVFCEGPKRIGKKSSRRYYLQNACYFKNFVNSKSLSLKIFILQPCVWFFFFDVTECSNVFCKEPKKDRNKIQINNYSMYDRCTMWHLLTFLCWHNIYLYVIIRFVGCHYKHIDSLSSLCVK